MPKESRRTDQIAQSLVRAVLYAAPALLCAYAGYVSDPDVWWHLRSAEWIVQHHAIPHTDPFSSFGAGKPWAAYSWLFELLVLQLFQHVGLVGIVVYTTGIVLAITIALHHLVKRLQADFTIAVLLTFVAALSLWRLDAPRSWHFTILFFILELDVLMHARRTGRIRELFWLPLIFALWSNLHIQFIDGLLVLALVTAESVAGTWWPAAKTRLAISAILPILAACILATLCNPYGAHIYAVARELAAQPGVIDHIAELQAIPFRTVSDYCVLVLTLAAAASLAVSFARSKRLCVFETAAFVVAVFLSFRSQRDVWIVASVASAIIASSLGQHDPASREPDPRNSLVYIRPLTWFLTTAATSLLLIAGFRALHVDNPHLQAQLEHDLPVRAAAFALEKGYPGPLYNDYPWGGYLMWSFRQRVSPQVGIDGRAALYGTDRMNRFAATWNAAPDWNADPDLQRAGLVIGPVKAPLTQLLRLDPHFAPVYEDPLAAVFIRR